MTSQDLKPLALWQSLLLVLIPATAACLALHYVVPAALAGAGQPFFVGYMVWWITWMGLVFIASLVAYRLEGNPLTWRAFASRYRLRKPDGRDWLWVVGLLAAHGLGLMALGLAGRWLASIPTLSMPVSFPPELRPGGTGELVAGEFMGMALLGKWWIVALYCLGWMLNILGEEYWWRGYMLPRQELAHGLWTWLIHGVQSTLFHSFWKWNLIAIFPGAMARSFVTAKLKNARPGIAAHWAQNALGLAAIFFGVIR